jgi:hypothetical protein
MVRDFEKSKERVFVILCSRRLGKSFMACTLAIEVALKKPNQLIKYLTTSAKAAKEIVMPLFLQILQTCPEDLRPTFHIHDNKWKFTNGSEILLHGVDKDGGESLRGFATDFLIVDEAGFVDRLKHVLQDVMSAPLIERNGRTLLVTTPPEIADHDFLLYLGRAERTKSLSKRILTDCPRFTQKQIEAFIEEAGGIDTDTCQREYFCQIIRSFDKAVVPEFTDKQMPFIVVPSFPALTYQPMRYVALDVGFVDNSGAVFGYYDFHRAKVCIQREYISKGCTTDEIAEGIRTTEQELKWHMMPSDRLRRYSDVDLRLIADLQKLYGIKFRKTEKDNKEATINLLRTLVRDKQIEIHESCVNLIQQLKYGTWKTSSSGKRVFSRSLELGHLDLVDALVYLVRNIDRRNNPIRGETALLPWFDYDSHKDSKTEAFKQAFRR